MLIAAVSTLALLFSAGPTLQSQLQAALGEHATPEAAEPVTTPAAQSETPISAPATDVTATEPNSAPETDAKDAASDTPTNADTLPIDSAGLRGEVLPADTRVQMAPAVTDTATDTVVTEIPETEIIVAEADRAEADQNVAAEAWPDILNAARTALKDTGTAKGRFVQTNADGTVAMGDFALNRPGRLRFDYDDPAPILIVADGITVAIEDSELETVDRVPLAATPLGIILDREVDFDGDVEVLSIRQVGERIGIEMRDSAGEMDGTLTLIFAATDYALLGWVAVDGNRQSTLVNLDDVKTNIRIDPRLFRLDEAEDDEDER